MIRSKLFPKSEAKSRAASYTKRMQKIGKPWYWAKAEKSKGGYRILFGGRRPY